MVPRMRSTFRIDDDLLLELKEQARNEKLPLTRLVNRVLRLGMRADRSGGPRRTRYREATQAMGAPRVDLQKALAVAAALEEDEILRKMTLRK